MEITKRQSIVVFFNNLRKIGSIKRMGDIKYISKEMHYLILYVDKVDVPTTIKKLRSFPFVKSAYASPRADLKVDFTKEATINEEG